MSAGATAAMMNEISAVLGNGKGKIGREIKCPIKRGLRRVRGFGVRFVRAVRAVLVSSGCASDCSVQWKISGPYNQQIYTLEL